MEKQQMRSEDVLRCPYRAQRRGSTFTQGAAPGYDEEPRWGWPESCKISEPTLDKHEIGSQNMDSMDVQDDSNTRQLCRADQYTDRIGSPALSVLAILLVLFRVLFPRGGPCFVTVYPRGTAGAI